MTKTKTFKNLVSLMLCIMFVVTGMWLAAEESSAMSYTGTGKISWYSNVPDYSHGYKVIGEAYVVGSNNKVNTNKFGRGEHVDAYSATGSGYASVTGNIQNLYNLYYKEYGKTTANKLYWPSGIEYYLCEGEKLQVVSYDSTYVYYYSPGFKSFGSSLYNCDTATLLESHPAGVYKVKLSDVWLDIQGRREFATSTNYVGTAQVIRETANVFQDLDMIGKARCYAYPVNTELKIVEPAPIKAANGYKYYKAVIKGNNAVEYFSCNDFYVYINEEYINYHANDAKIPDGYSVAKIAEVGAGKAAYVYPSKDNDEGKKAVFANDAKLKTYPSKSSDNRICIWYNDGYAYVHADKVKYYVDQLNIKDIVNDKYVLSWDPVPVEVVLTAKSIIGKNVTNNAVKLDGKNTSITLSANTSTYTVDNNVLYNYDGVLYGIEVSVQVKGDDTKGSREIRIPQNLSSLMCHYPQNNQMTINGSWIGKNYGTVIEYSTNKNFKNVKKTYADKNYYVIKGLKKNTKYYLRAYNTFNVKTENGSKLKKGKTSTFTVKTANISVAKPSIKNPSKGKKSLTVKWAKYKKVGSKHEVVIATNKSFTKNVKKAYPTKSLTSIRFSKLKAKTKYYVKMRTLYNYHGVQYKSSWSKVKTVKTK